LLSGLPEPGSGASGIRYRNHFLSYLRRDEVVEGGLGRLRFINLTRKENGKVYIGITDPGLNFCILENPVLDQHDYKQAFNYREINYYLDHISMLVPGEERTFKDILYLIYKGVKKSDALNDELKKKWPSKWTKAMINTHRSGAISRLAELGLITKTKMGKEVEFQLSQEGEKFLNR
jgi:hypothetical protein